MLPSECPDVQNLNSHCLQFSQQFCVTTNSASHQLPAIRAVCETKKSIPTTNPQCSPRTSSPGKSTKSRDWASAESHPTSTNLHPCSQCSAPGDTTATFSTMGFHNITCHTSLPENRLFPPPLCGLLLSVSLSRFLCSSWMELWPKSASFQVSLSFPAPLLPHGFPPDCSLISDHSTTPSTF